MKNLQILMVVASLALLSGCGGRGGENKVGGGKSVGAEMMVGEKVYKSTCSICHKSGMKGAPRMGSKDDWEARIAQGNAILYERAIKGYTGKRGSMPSRGSNARLSDDDVRAAVDYMVAHAIPSWTLER